jgi:tRNA U34 2-thiouridine synthase MnmA/TrmU
VSNRSIKKIKAVALISSGLDSLLAAKIVKDQGIDVRGVCYFYQFDSLSKKSQRGE